MDTNTQKKKNNSQPGFTLIELMVVIAIAGILASIALVNIGKNPDQEVRLEKDRFTAFLRDVQNKALSAEIPLESEEKEASGSDCFDSSHKWICGKVCGYGVRYATGTTNYFQPFYVVTSGTDILNVDCNSSNVSKKKEDVTGYSAAKDHGTPFYLKSGFGASLSDGNPPKDIFFLIPHGEVYYNNAEVSSDDEVSFNLQNTGAGVSVPVTIRPGGIIE